MSWFIYTPVWALVSFSLPNYKVHPWCTCLLIIIAINSFNPPYAGSIKQPDFFVRPDTIRVPSFIIESGWSESATELLNDMNLWLVGGAGTAKIVLLLKWSKVGNTNRVQGVMELYSLDANGIPIRRQREVTHTVHYLFITFYSKLTLYYR